MQDFFKFVLPSKHRFIPLRLSTSYIKVAQELALELLKLKDLNALRDRFEGIKFYNKILTILFGQYALEGLLNISCINIAKIRRKDFSSIFVINGISIVLYTFNVGELPLIEVGKYNQANIFIVKRNEKSGWLCGFIDSQSMADPINHRSRGNRTEFIGFNNLQIFSSYVELENLLQTTNNL